MTDTTTTGILLPEPAAVGARAAEILAAVRGGELYPRLERSARKYVDCWATFTGYPTVSQWDLDTDTEPLFHDAVKVLCLKAAVYELSGGDEEAAELLVSAPVDEMVHAIIAQFTLMTQLQQQLGVVFPHMTEMERFDYERGGYTDQIWVAAGFEEQNRRYWIDSPEIQRRLGVLNQRYGQAGIGRDGRRHDIDFDTDPVSATG
ncbi:MAG: hypothetical protein ACRD0H_11795 [Actinomycetes bacterium]